MPLSRYEISYGEGYWTGALYLVQGVTGLATGDKLGESRAVAFINIIIGAISVITSLITIILASLNIVYTPFDISYFYHGVRVLNI